MSNEKNFNLEKLNGNALKILMYLLENTNGVKSSAISVDLNIPKSSVSYIINELATHNLVNKNDQILGEDLRIKLISLTEEGTQFLFLLYKELDNYFNNNWNKNIIYFWI